MLKNLTIALVSLLLISCATNSDKAAESIPVFKEIGDFPFGIWEANVPRDSSFVRDPLPSAPSKIKIHKHRVGVVWGEVVATNGSVCAGDLSGDTVYAIPLDSFSDCVNLQNSRFEVLSDFTACSEFVIFSQSKILLSSKLSD